MKDRKRLRGRDDDGLVTGSVQPRENLFLRAVGATLEALFLLPPFAASTNR